MYKEENAGPGPLRSWEDIPSKSCPENDFSAADRTLFREGYLCLPGLQSSYEDMSRGKPDASRSVLRRGGLITTQYDFYAIPGVACLSCLKNRICSVVSPGSTNRTGKFDGRGRKAFPIEQVRGRQRMSTWPKPTVFQPAHESNGLSFRMLKNISYDLY